MATVSKWTPFGVALDITATKAAVTRTSATQYTVKINASWETYYSGAQTNYGMTASSGGSSVTLNKFGTKASSGSGSFTGTYSISGYGAGVKTITVTFKNFNTDNGDSATKTVSFGVTVPAWTSYTITYNANGGTGAPSAQTKWKNATLTLSTTKPTRTGYSFQGWATSASGSVVYAAGASYTTNASTTLYAVWKANTYTVTYNANGGTGAPSSQIKTYGVSLTLSTTKPTRTNYTFVGWGTSASATTATYFAGGTYSNNANVTLYAVWSLSYTPPRITDINVYRSDESDQPDDQGANLHFGLSYESDKGVATSITWQWKTPSDNDWIGSRSTPDSNSDGIVNTSTIYDSSQKNTIDPEKTYIVCITVTDSGGSTVKLVSIPGQIFPIDVKVGGKGISFGKAAEEEGLCDIGFQTKFTGGIKNETLTKATDLDDLTTPNTYVGINNVDYTNQPPGLTGTFTLEVLSAGDTVQVMQRITSCNKTASTIYERFYYQDAWGDWQTIGYSEGQRLLHTDSGRYMTAGHTITLTNGNALSNQPHGYLLVWSQRINETNYWYSNQYTFIPRYHLKHPAETNDSSGNLIGRDMIMPLVLPDGTVGGKVIMVREEKVNDVLTTTLTGYENNKTSPNNNWVLRYVLGV